MNVTEPAVGFGYKTSWLAIKATDSDDVIKRLGIRQAQSTAWREGIDVAYANGEQHRVYVLPAIDGWVLVTGSALFSIGGAHHEDKIAEFVTSLSASLGTVVQYFATHRGSDAHCWILAENGRLVRAYAVGDDDVLLERGELTAAERELKINFDIHQEGPSLPPNLSPADRPAALQQWRSAHTEREKYQVNEKMVMKIASKWSVNPTTLDGRPLPRGKLGIYP